MLINTVLERLQFNLSGGMVKVQMNHLQIGQTYILQDSTDLINWEGSGVTTFQPSSGTFYFEWPAVNWIFERPQRFYRLQWQP